MRKIISIAIVFALLSSMLLATVRIDATEPPLPDYEAVDWQTGLAGEISMPTISLPDGTQEIGSFALTPPVGTKAYDWYLRAISVGTPTGTQPWMTLRAISGNVEVWTQDYLWFLPGDPRNADPYNVMVSDAMCQYLADEFNNVIYPTDTSYFGHTYDRNGTNTIFQQLGYPSYYWDWIATDNPQRVILKVLNIRDTNYNNPNYPSYTAGFYSPTYTRTYYNRNMIHVDCWRWWQRLGPAGTVWFPERPDLVVGARSHLYESVTAHEYQHNIHRDWNPSDDTFMNEGCSDYAQFLCGYPETMWGHINYYLYTPDNSLTVWSDQGDINILADYGAACLWALYLVDHYGGATFLSHFVQAGIPGIAGINAALALFGYTQTFDDVFHDWRIANLIHSNLVADSRYNYVSINLNDPPAIQAFTHTISGIPVPWTTGTSFGTTWTWPNPTSYDTGVSKLGAYSSDYIVMNNWDDKGLIYFDGDDITIYGWTYNSANGYWSSGANNMMNTLLYSDTYVDPTNPTLQIITRYNIENLWDFGFVQVSTDGGNTWIPQSNAYTTSNHDPSALPAIVANLPGLTGQSSGYPSWLTMTFDLSAYAGQTVRLGFRYMTDQATLGAGWFLKEAKMGGTFLTLIPAYPEADFQVSLVRAYVQGGAVINYIVNDVTLADLTETGAKGTYVVQPDYVILVVSQVTPFGTLDYQVQAKIPPIRTDKLLR